MNDDFTCRNCGDYINEGTYCSKTCELAYTKPAFAREAASSGAVPFTAVQGTEKNQEFSTGAVRSEMSGKGRFDLIPAYPIRRLAQHYENGAKKYTTSTVSGDRNWEKGMPLSRYINSAERHMNAFKDGNRTEDHLAAILWNVAGYMWTERQIETGVLPDSLDDVPWEPSTGKML